jgi:hypothetical protein
MIRASLFRTGDPVVLVDALGQIRRDAIGRPMRGVVVRKSFLGELVVSLDRSGHHVNVLPDGARRCPHLAYVRPRGLVGGAA